MSAAELRGELSAKTSANFGLATLGSATRGSATRRGVRGEQRILVSLWLLIFAASSQIMMVAPILTSIGKELGVSVATLGNLMTVYAVAVGTFALVAGPVSDRVGRRRVRRGSSTRTTEPSGARFPLGKHTVSVRPRDASVFNKIALASMVTVAPGSVVRVTTPSLKELYRRREQRDNKGCDGNDSRLLRLEPGVEAIPQGSPPQSLLLVRQFLEDVLAELKRLLVVAVPVVLHVRLPSLLATLTYQKSETSPWTLRVCGFETWSAGISASFRHTFLDSRAW